jgi:hypothetical protein
MKWIYILISGGITVLLALHLYSSEWGRLNLMQYYSNNKKYEIAEEIGFKIIRKRSLYRPLMDQFKIFFCN